MCLKIAFGESRKAKNWKNTQITWEELKNRLKNVFRTGESAAEYARIKDKSDIKDKGGFVGGHLKGGIRKSSTVECRSMLTLDVDCASTTFLDMYSTLSSYTTLIYTTHSHKPDAPRYRLIIPLTRDISADEYQAVTRLLAGEYGIEQFDPCSFIPSQLMFWPTASRDGEFIFKEVEGEALNPDTFLAKYPNWKNPLTLPRTLREKPMYEAKAKAEDPTQKAGIIGAFCRTYTIEEAITNFLSDIYESAGNDRYHYIPSSSAPGMLVYEHKWAYSNHATDPAYQVEANAFDLVRIHKFPFDDDKKSFTAMSEWASRLPEVGRQMLQERQAEAVEIFDDWQDKLKRNKNGKLINEIRNLGLILTNDEKLKGIVFNELADGFEIKSNVPWKHPSRFWRDADDAQLKWYIDLNYGTFSKQVYDVAVTKIVDDRSYHPIKEFLTSLPAWDGMPRVDTLLIDYLGAEDSEYVRAVTRKMLCAAVKRIYNPGIKFDTLLVLIGAQGIGKSTLIAKLGGEWFSDSLALSDINDGKAAAEKVQGIWIMEIPELAGMRKAEQEKVKAFVSRQDDKYRAAFGHRVQPHLRQCIFFGTTNADSGFLRDITGNRRFWPVNVSGESNKKPWDLTEDDVAQIWAEVLTMKNESLILPDELEAEAEKARDDAIEIDERTGFVQQYLETLLPENWDEMDLYQRREFLEGGFGAKGTVERKTVSNMEIWCECFSKKLEDFNISSAWSIRAIMQSIKGWKPAKRMARLSIYGRQRIYVKSR